MSRPTRYRFGPFVLETFESHLLHAGARVELQPKVLDLIAYLVTHAGELIGRDELLDAVWPDAYVSDAALNQLLRRARAALGDDARRPRWIETVYGRGYRFIGQVDIEAEPEEHWPSRDRFVGRRTDLDALTATWDGGARRVVVVGPGGAGKTRLCTEHMRRTAGRWTFTARVEVAPIRTAGGLAAAVAAAMGVALRHGSEDDGIEQVGHALAHRGQGLVLIDNFEQLVPQGVPLLLRWVELAPEARWLITSRTRLDLGDEVVHTLAGLSAGDARELFLARAASAGVQLGAHWGPTIDRLAAELDGLPLAIELAAARAPILDPKTMRARLAERMTLLAGRVAGPQRHRSIRAALAWSWELLEPPEREALRCCALFGGAFTAAMAEQVVGRGSLLDELHSLQRQSLLAPAAAQVGAVAGRCRLAESVRTFASEQLATEDPARERFIDAMVARSMDVEALHEEWDPDLFESLRSDLPNLEAARQPTDGERAAVLDIGRATLLAHEGRCAEAGAIAEAIDCTGIGTRTAAHAVFVRGWIATLIARVEPRHLQEMQAAIDRLDPTAEATLAGYGYVIQAAAHQVLGQVELAHDVALAGVDAIPASHPGLVGRLLHQAGLAAYYAGHLAEAERLLEQGVTICPPGRFPRARVKVLSLRAWLAGQGGRYDEAVRGMREAVATGEVSEVGWALLSAHGNLGSMLQEAGRFDEALVAQDRAVEIAREAGARRYLAQTLINRGLTQLHRGDHGAAESDLLQARGITGAAGMFGSLVSLNMAALEAVRGRFDRCLEHTDAVLSMQADNPSAVVLAAVGVWRVVASLGRSDPEGARRELGRVRDLQAELPHHVAAPLDLLERRLGGRDTTDVDHAIPLVGLVQSALELVEASATKP